MSLLSKLEQRFGRFAIPHLTLGLILCQVVVWAYTISQRQPDEAAEVAPRLLLIPEKVLMITGNIAPANTTAILELMPMPNQMMNSGSKATRGVAYNADTNGSKT